MNDERVLLLALAALSVAAGLALRRYRARSPRWLWDLAELLSAVVAYFASFAGVWLFVRLAGYKAGESHTALAFASACLPTLLVGLAPPRYRPRVAGVVVAGLALLLLSDAVYFRFFGGIVPLLALGSAGHVWDARDSVLALFETKDLWVSAYVVVSGALLFVWPLAPSAPAAPRWRTLLLWLIPLAGLLAGSVPVQRDVDFYTSKSRSWKVFNVVDNLKWAGVLTAHARDVATAQRERSIATRLDPGDRAQVERYVKARADEAKRWRAAPSYGALAGTNVLVVQMEAMQQWLVDADVDGQPVMPFLRSLRERGLYFPNVFDQTGGSPTSDCEYLALNSLHPLARGAVAFRRAENDFVAVPELLVAQGYHTLSAHAYLRGMWNRGVVHPKYGFERSFFQREIGDEHKLGWGMGDKPFFKRLVEILRAEPRPFFAFAITLTSHHPYGYVPKGAWNPKMEGTPKRLRGYLRSARYVDEAIAELFAGIEEAGLAESTTIVLYGDHDSKLPFGTKHADATAKHMNLDKAALRLIGKRDASMDRIPLWIIPPSVERLPPALVTTVGGQIDIGPTLLHYLGVPAPAAFLGLPLLQEREGQVARHDGVAADSTRILRPSGRRFSCSAWPGAPAAKLECDDLQRSAETQLQVSKTVTLYDLAAELSRSRSLVDGGSIH